MIKGDKDHHRHHYQRPIDMSSTGARPNNPIRVKDVWHKINIAYKLTLRDYVHAYGGLNSYDQLNKMYKHAVMDCKCVVLFTTTTDEYAFLMKRARGLMERHSVILFAMSWLRIPDKVDVNHGIVNVKKLRRIESSVKSCYLKSKWNDDEANDSAVSEEDEDEDEEEDDSDENYFSAEKRAIDAKFLCREEPSLNDESNVVREEVRGNAGLQSTPLSSTTDDATNVAAKQTFAKSDYSAVTTATSTPTASTSTAESVVDGDKPNRSAEMNDNRGNDSDSDDYNDDDDEEDPILKETRGLWYLDPMLDPDGRMTFNAMLHRNFFGKVLLYIKHLKIANYVGIPFNKTYKLVDRAYLATLCQSLPCDD